MGMAHYVIGCIMEDHAFVVYAEMGGSREALALPYYIPLRIENNVTIKRGAAQIEGLLAGTYVALPDQTK